MFVEDNGKLVEKQISIEEVKEKYKSNILQMYPEYFFKKRKKTRGWQNEVGERIQQQFNIKSAIDFGCAQGYYLEGLHNRGCVVLGLEYAYKNIEPFVPESINHFILEADIQILNYYGTADLVMSIEVAEHLLPENSETYVKNICMCSPELILFSAAGPNQNGLGHINTRPIQDWLYMFDCNNYIFSERLTSEFRNIFKTLTTKNKYNKMLSRHVIGLEKK